MNEPSEFVNPDPADPTPQPTDAAPDGDAGPKRRRRRGRRGRGKGARPDAASQPSEGEDSAPEARAEIGAEGDAKRSESRSGGPRRRGRGGRGRGQSRGPAPDDQDLATPAHRPPIEDEDGDDEPDHEPPPVIAYSERDPDLFDLDQSWEAMGLSPATLKGLAAVGFGNPTIIQSKLIPPALAGKDVLGQAKTGTGKTAAFGLPLLSRVKPGEPLQALVLAPTRELATQIADSLKVLGRFSNLKIAPIYGGASIRGQADKLRSGPEIIVGTPGRIMDMVERRFMTFANFRLVVLDEVDRMLDIGFRDDIRRILKQTPAGRQTIMVSATISPEIEELARRYMHEPEKIVTSSGSLTVRMVEQHYLTVDPWDKKRLLLHLLTHEEPALTLVFCRLKRTVEDLAEFIAKHEIDVYPMHGDMRQSKRESVMKKLRAGKLGVVIASDLASRGLDVEGITHVINYDLPEDPEVYVHRIGRTARAGRGGIAWSFVTPEQGKLLTQIESLINLEVPKLEYPDFQARPRPEGFREPGARPTAPTIEGPARVPTSRFADREVPVAQAQDPAEQAKLAAKFPGGVVPAKMPEKRMFGKARTNRSNRL